MQKKELDEMFTSYEQDYYQGRADGYAGLTKRKNTTGYNEGYVSALQRKIAKSEVNVAYLGESFNIVISQNGASSKKLDKFIEKVKTNNDEATKQKVESIKTYDTPNYQEKNNKSFSKK